MFNRFIHKNEEVAADEEPVHGSVPIFDEDKESDLRVLTVSYADALNEYTLDRKKIEIERRDAKLYQAQQIVIAIKDAVDELEDNAISFTDKDEVQAEVIQLSQGLAESKPHIEEISEELNLDIANVDDNKLETILSACQRELETISSDDSKAYQDITAAVKNIKTHAITPFDEALAAINAEEKQILERIIQFAELKKDNQLFAKLKDRSAQLRELIKNCYTSKALHIVDGLMLTNDADKISDLRALLGLIRGFIVNYCPNVNTNPIQKKWDEIFATIALHHAKKISLLDAKSQEKQALLKMHELQKQLIQLVNQMIDAPGFQQGLFDDVVMDTNKKTNAIRVELEQKFQAVKIEQKKQKCYDEKAELVAVIEQQEAIIRQAQQEQQQKILSLKDKVAALQRALPIIKRFNELKRERQELNDIEANASQELSLKKITKKAYLHWKKGLNHFNNAINKKNKELLLRLQDHYQLVRAEPLQVRIHLEKIERQLQQDIARTKAAERPSRAKVAISFIVSSLLVLATVVSVVATALALIHPAGAFIAGLICLATAFSFLGYGLHQENIRRSPRKVSVNINASPSGLTSPAEIRQSLSLTAVDVIRSPVAALQAEIQASPQIELPPPVQYPAFVIRPR